MTKYYTEEERKQASKESSAKYYLKNKEYAREQNKKWYRDNREKVALKKRKRYFEGAVPHRIKQRELVLDAYGRKCSRCGVGSTSVYNDVIKQNFPKASFRLLCKNCNYLAWLEVKPPATTL